MAWLVVDKSEKEIGYGDIYTDDTGERILFIEDNNGLDWECKANECEMILDFRDGSKPFYRLTFNVNRS